MTRGALLLISISLLASACKPDEEEDPHNHGDHDHNEEELITTVRASFTQVGGGHSAEFSWIDIDGDGGNAPVITGDTLLVGTSYNAALLLLNESVSPADTVSNEVADEAEAHQFFFSTTGGSLTWASYGDTDANGLPIGLLSTWVAMGAGSGGITITLRHEPNKSAAGVSGGDITNAGGETDIEVEIPYVVQ
ncbi:MAG: type 1 periplasmic binding fold superfamily protein [Flavobacteriales bacterium]|nr:type 1 periplasmic binding fold superfamily protein [Flavobacteriales bacterium]